MDTYIVYVITDTQSRITAINSNAFLTDTTGWTQIDEGSEWPKFMHAQGNYFEGGLLESHGIPQYKLVNGEAVARTQAEIEADIAAIPAPPPTIEERLSDAEAMAFDNYINLLLLQ